MGITVGFGLLAGMLASQLEHVVGTAPILGALLCAACFLRKRDLLIIGVVAMLTRDVVTGLSWFTLVRLASVLSVIGVIAALHVRPSVKSLLLGLGISAPVYHLTLAIGDWITHTCSKEPWTTTGLANTLAGSLPYVQRSMLGELMCTGAFLGLYALAGYLATRRWPALIPQISRE